jgi:two-component system phosphate regulon sensor histidine kinase PhoR
MASCSFLSTPNSQYNDGTLEDNSMFDTGQALVEGPTKDNYGSFISGLAPIIAHNKVVAVIGIDVDASTYWRSIIVSSAIPVLVGMIICLILTVFERIRRHNAELLALRSELVSVASHELRNPITGIRWAAESILKMGTPEVRIQKMIQAILDSALHLQASTDDILELSHAANTRKLNIKPTDIVALLHEVVETQALSAQQKGLAVVFDQYWPPKLNINCDPDQMRRALHNVVSNAIKYTGRGTLVTISYQQTAKAHKILVSDQGIGIPASEQSKVFRGFYRASNAVRSDAPGTGLGLYLVKTVLQRHGGSVSFVSQENKGTTFTLILPR